MVFVPVRNDDAAEPILLVFQIGDIGNYQVDAQHVVFGKHHTGVDEDDIVAVFKHHTVLGDFAQAAQGDDAKRFVFCHRVGGISAADSSARLRVEILLYLLVRGLSS